MKISGVVGALTIDPTPRTTASELHYMQDKQENSTDFLEIPQ